MTDINGTYSCCNTINIFGEETEGEGGGGLTPGQEQDLNDVVEKTQLQSFVSPNTTDFIGNLTVNGLPVGGGYRSLTQDSPASCRQQFIAIFLGRVPTKSEKEKDAMV